MSFKQFHQKACLWLLDIFHKTQDVAPFKPQLLRAFEAYQSLESEPSVAMLQPLEAWEKNHLEFLAQRPGFNTFNQHHRLYSFFCREDTTELPKDDPLFFNYLYKITINSSQSTERLNQNLYSYVSAEKELIRGRLMKYHRYWLGALLRQAMLEFLPHQAITKERLHRSFSKNNHTKLWLETIEKLETKRKSNSYNLICYGTYLSSFDERIQNEFIEGLLHLSTIYQLPIAALDDLAILNRHISFLMGAFYPKLKDVLEDNPEQVLRSEMAVLLAEQRELPTFEPQKGYGEAWNLFIARLSSLPYYGKHKPKDYLTRFKIDSLQYWLNDHEYDKIITLWTSARELRETMGALPEKDEVKLPKIPSKPIRPHETPIIKEAQQILWDEDMPMDDSIPARLTRLIQTARTFGFDGRLSGKVMADSIRVMEAMRFISMNEQYLKFAYTHQFSSDKNILSAIFSSEDDQFKYQVIRDPYNNTSIHLMPERPWAYLKTSPPSDEAKEDIVKNKNIVLIATIHQWRMGYGFHGEYRETIIQEPDFLIKTLGSHNEEKITNREILQKIRAFADKHGIPTPLDLTLDYIKTLQESIADIVLVASELKQTELLLFFHKLDYQNDKGCMEARMGRAREYIKKLKQHHGVSLLEDVMEHLNAECIFAYPNYHEKDFDTYSALLKMANEKGYLNTISIIVSKGGAPELFNQKVFNTYCGEILGVEEKEQKMSDEALAIPKGLTRVHQYIHSTPDAEGFQKEDDAYLYAEMVHTYFGTQGYLSLKPQVYFDEGIYAVAAQKGHLTQQLGEAYNTWQETAILPPPFRTSMLPQDVQLNAFSNYFCARPHSHQNYLLYLYVLDKAIASEDVLVSKLALTLLMHAFLKLIRHSEPLQVTIENSSAWCKLIMDANGWQTCYEVLENLTLLEFAIKHHEDVAILLLPFKPNEYQDTAEGMPLRVFAALHNSHQVVEKLTISNPFLPATITEEQKSVLNPLKNLAFAYFSKTTGIDSGHVATELQLKQYKASIEEMVSRAGFKTHEAFLNFMPTPYNERSKHVKERKSARFFALYCQYICDEIHKFEAKTPNWKLSSRFWQDKIATLAKSNEFDLVNHIAQAFEIPTFDSVSSLCIKEAYVQFLFERMAAIAITLSPIERKKCSNAFLLLSTTSYDSEEHRLTAAFWQCPTIADFILHEQALPLAKNFYLQKIALSNNYFAEFDQYSYKPSDAVELLEAVKKSPSKEIASKNIPPALAFLQFNAVPLSSKTVNPSLNLLLSHLDNSFSWPLYQAKLQHFQLLMEMRSKQVLLPIVVKEQLLGRIERACRKANRHDLLIRLSELILNTITVSTFQNSVIQRGELCFALLGNGSLAYTDPWTESPEIVSARNHRATHETLLLQRCTESYEKPEMGFTYAHLNIFARRQTPTGGSELIPLGDPKYGPNCIISTPTLHQSSVLVKGAITRADTQSNKPLVIRTREDVFSLLHSFPEPVLQAYLHLLTEGCFPSNAKHEYERAPRHDGHCDITITSLNAPALPFEERHFSNIMVSPSLPVSQEAMFRLLCAQKITIDAHSTAVLEERLKGFFDAINTEYLDLLETYLSTYPFFTRYITDRAEGVVGYAIHHEKFLAAEKLIMHGASPFLTDTEGNTALHLLMQSNACALPLKNRLIFLMIDSAIDKEILLMKNNKREYAFQLDTLPTAIQEKLSHHQAFLEAKAEMQHRAARAGQLLVFSAPMLSRHGHFAAHAGQKRGHQGSTETEGEEVSNKLARVGD